MMQAALILCFLASVSAWAPPAHPAPGKLPKALEFAENAWKFPQDIHSQDAVAVNTIQQLEEDENRRYPWSPPTAATEKEDLSLSCMEDGDHFYFDGHQSISLRWPTRQAFLDSLPKPELTVKSVVVEEAEDCEEPYYDDTGDVLCWATVGAAVASTPEPAMEIEEEDEEECEHFYFDRIGGEELCWATVLDVAQTMAATKKLTKQLTSHPGHAEFDEDCEEPYFDDTGDVLCWAI